MVVLLKLGGSLITDKAQKETPRIDKIKTIAQILAETYRNNPNMKLIIGHGSGSFGHVAAKRHGTRDGVNTPDQWVGFSEVSVSAARLNHIILEALAGENLPVFRIQPSASILCEDGTIQSMTLNPLRIALENSLVPLIHGDVAVDSVQGGTIVSTEEVFYYLAQHFEVKNILLAGDFESVLDKEGNRIPHITPDNIHNYLHALGGASGTDVTGGMYSKVMGMLALCKKHPETSIDLFSGKDPENIRTALLYPDKLKGTRISL